MMTRLTVVELRGLGADAIVGDTLDIVEVDSADSLDRSLRAAADTVRGTRGSGTSGGSRGIVHGRNIASPPVKRPKLFRRQHFRTFQDAQACDVGRVSSSRALCTQRRAGAGRLSVRGSTACADVWTLRQRNELGVDRRRSPCRLAQQGDRLVVNRHSGIQTPKSQKPHWLNPGSHTGVTVFPQ